MLIFLFTISLIVVTFLVLYGLLQSKVRSETEVQSRIKKIDAITAMPRKGREKTEAEKAALRGRSLEEMTFSERVIQPLMEKFGQFLGQFAPAGMAKSLEHRIVLAGKQREWSVGQLFAAIFFGAAAMCVLSWLYLQAADFSAVQKVAIVLLGTFIGGYAPISVTKIMASKRQQAIQAQLPEMLDLLCVSVQAGLSFDSSLRKIIGRMHGPLIDECRHFQEDVRMGMVRRTALKNLAQRCEVQEVSLFVAALGITNTMIMSIYERTREIGVMKVLGCDMGNIRSMFLIESGFIGFMGGVLGALLSYGVSIIVNRFVSMSDMMGMSGNLSRIPLWLAFAAIGFAIFVGMAAGFMPAMRAMKLSPLAAIRNE